MERKGTIKAYRNERGWYITLTTETGWLLRDWSGINPAAFDAAMTEAEEIRHHYEMPMLMFT